MAGHFYGTAKEEHYEKDVKDFASKDWFVTLLFFGLIFSTIGMGFLGHIGIMIMLIGVDVIMMDVMLRVIIGVKSKIMLFFDAVGIAIIIAGVLVQADCIGWLIIYCIGLYMLVCYGVGIACLIIGVRMQRKIREYSLTVDAECVIVDKKYINLFRFDDITGHQYNDPINDNELKKTAFRYVVNGREYFTESTVYYGDLNTGFEDGAIIKLRVNPSNPTDVLPQNTSSFIPMFMGVFWLALGIISTVVAVIVAGMGKFGYLLNQF